MTPRERAEAIPATRFTLRDAWIDAIEQAIIAAEDTAFKAGAEKERAACLQIAANAEREYETRRQKYLQIAASEIKKSIRARGDK